MRDQESFDRGETAEAIIIGGGVIGLSLARSLVQRGMKHVVLIERARPGAEASSAAGGMLAVQAEADRADAFLDLARASRDLYTEFAAALFEETGIDIELERTGTLYLAFDEEDLREIERRYEWQTRAGLSVEKLTRLEARELEPCVSEKVRGALKFPLDVQVENRRLVAALLAWLEKYQVRLLTGTEVQSIRIERGRVMGVNTSRGSLSAPVVIVAAGAWSSLLSARAGNDDDKTEPRIMVEPVRGQMLCFETPQRLTRHIIYSPRGYLVPRMDGRLLAGSTTERAGFDKRVTGGGLHSILTNALEIAPALSGLAFQEAWAGLRPRAEDELPVLGSSAEARGLFYATGHYRNGILLAPITAELLADAVTGRGISPLLDAFTPNRFHYACIS